MWLYILKRLGLMVPMLLGITLISFTVIHLAPGRIMEEMGAPAQKLVVNEVAQEGAVGVGVLAHEASGNNYFPDITAGYVV